MVALLHDPRDIDSWLALRQRAFAQEHPPVRPWTRSDFLREFRENPRGAHRFSWLARRAGDGQERVLGAVSLSLPRPPKTTAGLHWLMVDPSFRRRGIGALLLETAERYSWSQGFRELRVETHRDWQAAVRFYQSRGFRRLASSS